MDVVILRAIERIVIAFGGILSIYLGYRLFMEGIQKGKGEMKAESKFFTLLFSGVGPGLFFMFTGGFILVTSLFTGHASKVEHTNQVGTLTITGSDNARNIEPVESLGETHHIDEKNQSKK